jgi:type VII secretion integral membrane protein EccD
VTRAIGLGLARVTVVAPHSRADVALPEHVLLAELMPGLLRGAGDDTDLADAGQQHGGWVLRRGDGSALDGNRTLAAQHVLDGDLLYLVPRRTEWPEPEYDDLVDAVAGEARRHTRPWSYATTRAFGLGAAAGLLGLLPVLLIALGPPWPAQTAVIGALAGLLLVAGSAFSRALADAGAGTVLGALALPYAALAGVLLAAPDTGPGGWGSAQVLAGCAGLFAAAVLADVAVAGGTPVFVAGVVVAAGTALATLLQVAGLTTAGAAAVLASVLVVGAPTVPLLALRLGKVPAPAPPTSTADLLRDDDLPPRRQVHARVLRADQLLTGIGWASALLLAGCQLLLVAARDGSSTVLAVLVAGTALLRARLYPTLRHRLPLLLTGLAGAGSLGLAALALPRGTVLVLLTAAGVTLAAVAVAAGLVYGRRRANPGLGRLGDVLEVLGVVCVVPMACAVLGLYGRMRGLAG